MSCCVADQYCDAPANLEGVERIRIGLCVSCDEPVCKECSSHRSYFGKKRQRLCNSCQEHLDGNDDLVMLRLFHRSGYPAVTLRSVRERRLAAERASRRPNRWW